MVVLRHAQQSTTVGIGGSTKWAAQNQATHTLFVEVKHVKKLIIRYREDKDSNQKVTIVFADGSSSQMRKDVLIGNVAAFALKRFQHELESREIDLGATPLE